MFTIRVNRKKAYTFTSLYEYPRRRVDITVLFLRLSSSKGSSLNCSSRRSSLPSRVSSPECVSLSPMTLSKLKTCTFLSRL
eukprot:GSChrysophyteH1.ASY1.ANO1.36.1 assembled CDS